jgi:hypothetical protein
MPRFVRILFVTAGLTVTGAIVGAICAASSLAIVLLVAEPAGSGPYFYDALAFAGYVGALLGAIATPIIAWTLLRRVTLGRAIAHSVVGTIIGGLVGATLGGDAFVVPALAGALIGFVLAALRLWHQTSSRRYRVLTSQAEGPRPVR